MFGGWNLILDICITEPARPKHFLIFHNGKFLKGAIVEVKLTEQQIMSTLTGKGVQDLAKIDTIILEKNGELSIIYKDKN